MKNITINTNYFRVAINYNTTTEYVAGNRLVTMPDDAVFYDQDEAEELQEIYAEKYPNCSVTIEAVTEEKTAHELAEAIAEVYNSRTAGWDFQHSGQSRNYEAVEEMCSKLESTLFCARDIVNSIEFDGDTRTIEEWALYVADAVAQRITKNQYGDVNFIVSLK